MKVRMIKWDWKEQVDLGELSGALTQVFDGSNLPCINDVGTGTDDYCAVISSEKIDKVRAQEIFDMEWLDDDVDPFNVVVEVD